MRDTNEAATLDERIAARFATLSPAEQRVARFLADRRSEVVLWSAAQLAAEVGTSDATVVRAVQALGYASISVLRRDLLAQISGGPTPAARLRRTLDEAGDDVGRAFDLVLSIQEDALSALHDPEVRSDAAAAVTMLSKAKRVAVYGIGPSRPLADYFVLQLARLGRAALPLTATGIQLADQLLCLARGDVVVMLAYSRIYAEVSATLSHAQSLGIPVVLVSDSLGAALRDSVALVLPARRGRAGRMSMHTATFALLEALLLGLAVRGRDAALATLQTLDDLRAEIAGERLDVGREAHEP